MQKGLCGRPKKPANEKRVHRVEIKLTDEELNRLENITNKLHTTRTNALLWGLELLEENNK